MVFDPFGKTRGKLDNYPTPKKLFDQLDQEFHFTHDPCPINPKGLREVDGLGDWGRSNFVNPPYSKKEPWIRKAVEEQEKGNLTVMLLPVDTSTAWFHMWVLPYAEIRWIRGRVHFSKGPAKFPSMIAIFEPASWRVKRESQERLAVST